MVVDLIFLTGVVKGSGLWHLARSQRNVNSFDNKNMPIRLLRRLTAIFLIESEYSEVR